jgi:hypothetical protein
MQDLVDRRALVLAAHVHDGDELHVTYNAKQSGWQEPPAPKDGLSCRPEMGWTELRFARADLICGFLRISTTGFEQEKRGFVQPFTGLNPDGGGARERDDAWHVHSDRHRSPLEA